MGAGRMERCGRAAAREGMSRLHALPTSPKAPWPSTLNLWYRDRNSGPHSSICGFEGVLCNALKLFQGRKVIWAVVCDEICCEKVS
jgi:hypothetical protein